MQALADRIDAALPQTQCTRCGYPDCRAYAEAIVEEDAAINRCPPGGAEGVERLAALTGRALLPLDPTCGEEGPRVMAVIDEAWCIGCTLCLDACPTDAILGINKRMHTVVETHCTGCELCVPVCPVDCISLAVETPGLSGWRAWSATQAEAARRRYGAHRARQARDAAATALPPVAPTDVEAAAARKRAIIEAALARAAAVRRGPPDSDGA
ncbi:RnfABCDGE type electron transport complex subunit B [Variovorax sp. PvP013]|uniref:RnfABCDGE type electron transport complex subunit B n=1 Tax=Variovorax sp. PvP013 TaxID=3156435 RepID=UPI003D1B1CB3